jgi:SAM-dependent methyltransferase
MASTPYDALAPHYAAYARSRARYCDRIDRLIRSRLKTPAGTWLDVGSGDGGRATRLAQAAHASRLVLSDPSEPMAALCLAQGHGEVWQTRAEQLPAPGVRFDVVTCLWNVLGSVEGDPRRVVALERMRGLLAPGGRLFLDVHNRYNARTAGVARVMARVLRDRLRPTERNGVVSFVWQVAGEEIPTTGYLFAPAEMSRLFKRAGLLIIDRRFVDYDTGAPGGRWSGQMFFELAPHARP